MNGFEGMMQAHSVAAANAAQVKKQEAHNAAVMAALEAEGMVLTSAGWKQV